MRELGLNDERRAGTIDAITLWMPWPLWIAWGWKPIETRRHTRFERLAGRELAIHAGQRFDETAIESAKAYLTAAQITTTLRAMESVPRMAVLCIVDVEDFRRLTPADAPAALIECDTRRYGLILGNVRQLAKPFPMRGRQTIFKIRRDLLLPNGRDFYRFGPGVHSQLDRQSQAADPPLSNGDEAGVAEP